LTERERILAVCRGEGERVLSPVKVHYYNCTTLFVLELTMDPPEGIAAGPISEDNFFEWEALIA